MRTAAPAALPIFRSEMQLRLLGLVLLQPERDWTLDQLANALSAPPSSVHRELGRAEAAGLLLRDAAARPHRFRAATEDPLYEPLHALLNRTVGVEGQLRAALERPGVDVALIYGSWATESRRPGSDIDVLVVGSAELPELRRAVRPVGKAAGRTIDLAVFGGDELRRLVAGRSSFARQVLEKPTVPLIGRLASVLAE
jgi:predicted nucleotidyltransferase